MKLFKKIAAVLSAGTVIASFGVGASAEGVPSGDFGIWDEIAGENGTTYGNLFDLIFQEKYADIWNDYCSVIVGEDNAAAVCAAMQNHVGATIYGQEAIDKNAETGGMDFDCLFINGAELFTFKDKTATVKLSDGTEVSHEYEYLGEYEIGGGETVNMGGAEISVAFPCDVYKSTDEAGEFNYFFFRDDTMSATYHIEFRYGSDLEELQGYFKGKYAYWLGAGIDTNANAQTIENVIALFCLENMDYSERTSGSLAQIAELVGIWDADLSAFGDAYANVELYLDIDKTGHGVTYMNGAKTRDFNAYMFDSGTKGDGEGIYAAYDNEAFEPESAKYTLKENDNGDLVLTLYAVDGTISYIKRGSGADTATAVPVSANPPTGVGGVSGLVFAALGAGALMLISKKSSK
ncbi:MAG: hypothetical protein NC237_05845 [Eubacterium sp.]|nr:hypothetical protein [Eubacterium sp.]MCM1419219.1 hypothetical protein [Roseburia sp.]